MLLSTDLLKEARKCNEYRQMKEVSMYLNRFATIRNAKISNENQLVIGGTAKCIRRRTLTCDDFASVLNIISQENKN